MLRTVRALLTAGAVASVAGAAMAEEVEMGEPALHGYCPVAYVAMGQAVKGDPELLLEYRGHHYLFANADARRMFEADPAAYDVAYDGWCATAAAVNQRVESDPTLFVVRDGVTYLFSSAEARKMFEADPAAHAYDVVYGGLCATALSMGQEVQGDPGIFTVTDGKTFFFSSEDAKQAFDADPESIRAKADAHWVAPDES